MTKTLLPFLLLALLSACSSTGMPYREPSDSEESAELSAPGFYVHTFTERGCYIGRTMIDDKIRLHANRDAVFLFSAYAGEGDKYLKTTYSCDVFFSFSPEKNARYVAEGKLQGKILRSGESNRYPPGCRAIVHKIEDDGSKSPVKLQRRGLQSSGLACIKIIPFE